MTDEQFKLLLAAFSLPLASAMAAKSLNPIRDIPFHALNLAEALIAASKVPKEPPPAEKPATKVIL